MKRIKQIYNALRLYKKRIDWVEYSYKRYKIYGHVCPYESRLEYWYDIRIDYSKGRSHIFVSGPSNYEYCKKVFPDIVKSDSGIIVEQGNALSQ